MVHDEVYQFSPAWDENLCATVQDLKSFCTICKELKCNPRQPKRSTVEVPGYCLSDYYCIFVTVLLLPILIVCYVGILVFSLPVLIWLRLYIGCYPKPTNSISRGCGFQLFAMFSFILSIPSMVFVLLFLIIGGAIMFVFSLLYSIISCKIRHFCSNMKLMKQWRHTGQWCWGDVVIAVMGAMYRQGLCEFWPKFPTMFTVVPLFKYLYVANPLMQKLSIKHANQWTRSLNLSDDSAIAGTVHNVSIALHSGKDRDDIDEDVFSAYYQFPPAKRKNRTAIGIQFLPSLVNFTHTTHNVKGIKFRSKTAKRGVYQVPLYFWNPFHILTGYVEVNLQPNGAMEHPMWCIAGENHWGNQVLKNADSVFWTWAPEAGDYFTSHGSVVDS